MLTVHYEIYDGLPLISKWWTLEVRPGWNDAAYAAGGKSAHAARASPPAPPSGTVGGWHAAGGQLSVQDDKLDLLQPAAPGGPSAGAGYLEASDSAGFTLGATAGTGEHQTSLGLGLSASTYTREAWEVMASCDRPGSTTAT
jgi:hypothetical protein